MTSIRTPRPSPRAQPKKTVTLESQLSELRSQTDVWDIGKQTAVLEEQIKKNERLN